MERLVTVISCQNLSEAIIIRSKFESEDIFCLIRNEHAIGLKPFYEGSSNGVEVQVRAEDVPHAIELIKEGGYFNEQDYQPSSFQINLTKFLSKIPFFKRFYK